jgi:hypothetical protein
VRHSGCVWWLAAGEKGEREGEPRREPLALTVWLSRQAPSVTWVCRRGWDPSDIHVPYHVYLPLNQGGHTTLHLAWQDHAQRSDTAAASGSANGAWGARAPSCMYALTFMAQNAHRSLAAYPLHCKQWPFKLWLSLVDVIAH